MILQDIRYLSLIFLQTLNCPPSVSCINNTDHPLLSICVCSVSNCSHGSLFLQNMVREEKDRKKNIIDNDLCTLTILSFFCSSSFKYLVMIVIRCQDMILHQMLCYIYSSSLTVLTFYCIYFNIFLFLNMFLNNHSCF